MYLAPEPYTSTSPAQGCVGWCLAQSSNRETEDRFRSRTWSAAARVPQRHTV